MVIREGASATTNWNPVHLALKKVEVQEAREFGNENSVLCESGDETRMTWDYIVKFNANASDHVRYEN